MPPYTRHNEVPILNSRPGHVDADNFNQVQTALKRIDCQIRFKIPKLNHLDLIVQQDAWIVVDRVLNDVPIAAWTNFETKWRDSLHEPVPCEIRLYHFAARMILETTLDAMETILKQSLAEDKNHDASTVLSFKKES